MPWLSAAISTLCGLVFTWDFRAMLLCAFRHHEPTASAPIAKEKANRFRSFADVAKELETLYSRVGLGRSRFISVPSAHSPKVPLNELLYLEKN